MRRALLPAGPLWGRSCSVVRQRAIAGGGPGLLLGQVPPAMRATPEGVDVSLTNYAVSYCAFCKPSAFSVGCFLFGRFAAGHVRSMNDTLMDLGGFGDYRYELFSPRRVPAGRQGFVQESPPILHFFFNAT